MRERCGFWTETGGLAAFRSLSHRRRGELEINKISDRAWPNRSGGILLCIPLYLTAYKIKEAAAQGDAEKLSEYVDFESVKESLKDQLNAVMTKEMEDGVADDPFAGLGALFSGALIDGMIDSYVTPEGLAALMKGEAPALGGEAQAGVGKPALSSDVSMGYESLNRFVITLKGDTPKQDIKIVLERDGFSWKITDIRLPGQV
ncbi:MAG: DUF2939 domain-containing protein [Actinomycetota bacterium]|nr:DUF2939 domain-containing protein [Actinomycetota bacterium]